MNDSRSVSVVSGLALLVGGLVAGCSSSPAGQNTITIAAAEQRVEDYFRRALAALPEEARAEPGLIETYGCDDPNDDGPKGRKIASVDYEINDLSRYDHPQHVTRLENWWLNHNFYVLNDERPAYQSVWVENIDDEFRMRVIAAEEDGLVLIATSPCVWPDGTPESE